MDTRRRLRTAGYYLVLAALTGGELYFAYRFVRDLRDLVEAIKDVIF